jgi:hypothetical protein
LPFVKVDIGDDVGSVDVTFDYRVIPPLTVVNWRERPAFTVSKLCLMPIKIR